MSAFKQHTADIRLFVRTDFEFHRIGITHFLQSCLNRILTGKEQFLAGNRQGDIFIGRNFTRQVNARRFGHLFAKSLKCFIRHLFVVSLPQSFGQHLNGRKSTDMHILLRNTVTTLVIPYGKHSAQYPRSAFGKCLLAVYHPGSPCLIQPLMVQKLAIVARTGHNIQIGIASIDKLISIF